jgi:predicted ATPase
VCKRVQGRIRDAHDRLASAYSQFTDGFGTLDLQEAKQLLDELAQLR